MLSLRPNALLAAAFMLATLSPISLAHDRDYERASPGQTKIALAIAKETLERHGIAQPTREELKAALNGGTITRKSGERVRLEGVLKQREKGMGWGQIAQANGFKLGEAMRHKPDRRHADFKHRHDRHGGKLERHARHDKFERHHRHDKFERHERHQRAERPERVRHERYERYERPERHRRG